LNRIRTDATNKNRVRSRPSSAQMRVSIVSQAVGSQSLSIGPKNFIKAIDKSRAFIDAVRIRSA
jgi:hypothetical protein